MRCKQGRQEGKSDEAGIRREGAGEGERDGTLLRRSERWFTSKKEAGTNSKRIAPQETHQETAKERGLSHNGEKKIENSVVNKNDY